MNFFGLELQQNIYAPTLLTGLFEDEVPELILEMGTAFGGLTVGLWIWGFLNGCRVMSWDIVNNKVRKVDKLMTAIGAEFKLKSCLDPAEIGMIRTLISKSGKTFVLCDGGNKAEEVRTFAPMLKVGDIIAAHDYCPSPRTFDKRYRHAIWMNYEIGDDSRRELEKIGFEIYAPELAMAAWLCMKRVMK